MKKFSVRQIFLKEIFSPFCIADICLMSNPLIEKLRCYGPLTPETESELSRKIRYYERKKDDFFLKEGQVISSLFLLDRGLIRAFFHRKGKEVNSWFAGEGLILGLILPLYFRKPSFENIQFLEDSAIYSIPFDDFDALCHRFQDLNTIGRKFAEELCLIMEERITSLHTESVEERYASLIASNPEFLQRINLGHIASYLGVTQETLSRIRGRKF